MSNIGFGSNILQRLLEKYLYIGYTEIHVYEKDKKMKYTSIEVLQEQIYLNLI